ncbi:NUDIX hydrolase [Marinibacterium profundimaris]|uniref:DNA mismatch repair protein MutT n=1 Tax=Marinibacterium profundimaris TaxID=1679460 RepID=A0A225NP57_9RHOB|nr:NUDIX hydrolase [Marinibacterium profundimaris]OWU76195.1 DNA mismatch repair protein MutT [Marinibacterium profundimaris]
MTDFSGAKAALFLGPDLLVIQRDDRTDIPWPGRWDLPGGGRENGESPVACALRETEEEVGLRLSADDMIWSRSYLRPHGRVWFFVGHFSPDLRSRIRFGDEGQGWELMRPETYLAHPLNIPHFAEQLQIYLDEPRAAARLAS